MTNYGIRPLGAIALLVAMGAACGPKAADGGGRIDPALMRYVTPDVLAVSDVQWTRLRTTNFYVRHRQEIEKLAPVRHEGDLLLTWNGKGLLIAQKTVDGKVVLAGDPDAAARAENAAKSGTGSLPDELARALAEAPAGAQIQILNRGLPLEGVHLPSQYASLLANFRGHIERAALGVEAGTGLKLRARVDCFSEQGALRVEVALRAGIGYGKLSASTKNPMEARVYDALEVRREGTAVFVDAEYSPELSDYLLHWALEAAHP